MAWRWKGYRPLNLNQRRYCTLNVFHSASIITSVWHLYVSWGDSVSMTHLCASKLFTTSLLHFVPTEMSDPWSRLPPSITSPKSRTYDDVPSHRLSVWLLLSFAAIITTEQYSGNPAQCWTSKHFTSSHTTYANRICWVQNHFYALNDTANALEDKRVAYYHFVPLILILQAILCALPGFIWKHYCQQSDFNLAGILDMAHDIKKHPSLSMDYIIRQIAPEDCAEAEQGLCGKVLKRRTMCLSFLMVKLCYMVNALVQLTLINMALGVDGRPYGFVAIYNFSQGKDGSDRFPRTIFCHFNVRRLGNVQQYAYQCVMPVNRINDVVFVFVWFWFLFLSYQSSINLFRWCHRLLSSNARKANITCILRAAGTVSDKHLPPEKVSRFTLSFLSHDGVLAVQLIDVICGRFTAANVTGTLWNRFIEGEAKVQEMTTSLWSDGIYTA